MKLRMTSPGITLVEVMVGISIIAAIAVAVGLAVNSYVAARAALLQNLKAVYLAEEGYEMLRAVRDNDWNTISAEPINVSRYLAVSGSDITISNSPEIIDGFTRSFVIREVYRRGGDIVPPSIGATLDNGSKMIEVYVAGANSTSSLQGLLTNLFAQ